MTHPNAAVKTTPQRTELGLFPSEWVVAPLSELEPFVTSGSRGWAAFYSEHGDLFVRITNLSRESIYLNLDDCKFVKLAQRSGEGVRTRLQEHDVLISITADIGIVGYVDSTVPSPAYINQHIALVRFDANKTCGKFVSYFLASERPQRLFRAATDTGAKAGMSLTAVLKVQTAVPPLREQRAIAEALSDVDALLAGLDRLIAKKRDLKQAVMQQLLTGRVRLPGYSRSWKRRKLGEDIADLLAGVSVNSTVGDADAAIGGPAVLKTSAVANGEFKPWEAKTIAAADIHRVQLTPMAETVLISRMNTIDLVGECGYVNANHPNLFVPDRLWMTRFRNGAHLSARWLAFLLNTPAARLLVKNIATGTSGSMKNISKAAFLNLEFDVPEIAEQIAISTALSDMHEEVAALEIQREKTRTLKQAMMQELLTGRIRLI